MGSQRVLALHKRTASFNDGAEVRWIRTVLLDVRPEKGAPECGGGRARQGGWCGGLGAAALSAGVCAVLARRALFQVLMQSDCRLHPVLVDRTARRRPIHVADP